MYSELTIIKLQFMAAILMGYEYFVSEPIKQRLDAWAIVAAQKIQKQSDVAIQAQIVVLKKNMPLYVGAAIFLALGAGAFWLIRLFENDAELWWVAIVLVLTSIFFVVGAFRAVLDRLVIEGLAPMVLPLGTRVLTTYLLFTSKKAIAGMGMLFLMASFWARYSNAVQSA